MMTRNRLVTVLAVSGGYVTVGFLKYRQRVMSEAILWDSDLLVFALPAGIAFVAFARALWPVGSSDPSVRRPRVRAIALALLATAVAIWVYLSIAFTRYGT